MDNCPLNKGLTSPSLRPYELIGYGLSPFFIRIKIPRTHMEVDEIISDYLEYLILELCWIGEIRVNTRGIHSSDQDSIDRLRWIGPRDIDHNCFFLMVAYIPP